MSDEIKEILDKLEIVARKHTIEVCEDGSKIETMPASVIDELRLNNFSAKVLLDYITNLQQENERLKGISYDPEETNNNWTIEESELIKAFKERNDYKSRVEKAVEYINNFSVDKSFSFPLMKRWEENQVKGSIDYEFKITLYKDLLTILQGESNEE